MWSVGFTKTVLGTRSTLRLQFCINPLSLTYFILSTYPKGILSLTTTPSIPAMLGGCRGSSLKQQTVLCSRRHFFYKQNLSPPSLQTSSQTDSKGRQDKRSFNGLFNSAHSGWGSHTHSKLTRPCSSCMLSQLTREKRRGRYIYALREQNL